MICKILGVLPVLVLSGCMTLSNPDTAKVNRGTMPDYIFHVPSISGNTKSWTE